MSPEGRLEREMTRLLVALSVGATVVVSAAVVLLVANALTGSWLWGTVVAACLVVVFLLGVALFVQWGRSHAERVERFPRSLGRAMAFGSGGREQRSDRNRQNSQNS